MSPTLMFICLLQIPNECCYQGHQPLTTFAFRVHTHLLGRSVDMTREKWDHSGADAGGG